MKFELPPLPYARDAFEPHLSARMLDVHYEGHHRGYLAKLERLIENKPEAEQELEDLFGSGYVWLYVGRQSDRLVLEAMPDAEGPIARGAVLILGMDMWEHAYYLDYPNQKGGYIEAFFSELADWDFAEENLRQAS